MKNRDCGSWITRYHHPNGVLLQEDRPKSDISSIFSKLVNWLFDVAYMTPSVRRLTCLPVHTDSTPKSSSKMSTYRYGLICNRVSACPKTRADVCRLQCQERLQEAACSSGPAPPLASSGHCAGPPPIGGSVGPPPVPPCAPKPPCIPPCRMCPPCLQPCHPCPPCPPPCRPCLPCPPSITKPTCSDYSHTTTECYLNGCSTVPCRWDNTSYYNEGNDAAGNIVRQWNTSCHFATRPTNGSCNQIPASHSHYAVNVPCAQGQPIPVIPCSQAQSVPIVQSPCPSECPTYPLRCRRDVIINLPKSKRQPEQIGIRPPTTVSPSDLATPTSIFISPTKVVTPVSPPSVGKGRRKSRSPARKSSSGKRLRSPSAKGSPISKQSPRRSPKRSPRRSPKRSPLSKRSPSVKRKSPVSSKKSASPAPSLGRRSSRGRKLSQGSKKLSPITQIVISRRESDLEDFELMPVALDTSMFSNRSSQLRWIESRRRMYNVNRRKLSEDGSSVKQPYQGDTDRSSEPDFQPEDQEAVPRQLPEW